MKLAKILSVLKTEPLFCSDIYRDTLLELFNQHALLSKEDFRASRTGMAKSGSLLDVDQMEIENGLAIIPVGGPIGMGLDEFEKGAGAVDVDDIATEINQAETDDEVEALILDIDSPGGMVTGTPELGKKILAVQKPIYAFTRGQMCSAAYWLGSCADAIFATESSDVGCIGVCAKFLDLSKMADMAGVKVKVFVSGDYKGAGTPGTSLTAQQEMLLQKRVMELADMFYKHVRAQRGDVADEDMQGQTFKGETAQEKCLVDWLVEDLDSCKEEVKSLIALE